MTTETQLHSIRNKFFDSIIETILGPTTPMDVFLDQDKYYVLPKSDEIYRNTKYGDLVIPVEGSFFGRDFRISYSLWHIGERVKIGIMVKDADLQSAFMNDQHREVNAIWGKDQPPTVDAAHGALLCEWEFFCPDFYDSYVYQEKFVLGMRHMHFRAMRIIHDNLRDLDAAAKPYVEMESFPAK